MARRGVMEALLESHADEKRFNDAACRRNTASSTIA